MKTREEEVKKIIGTNKFREFLEEEFKIANHTAWTGWDIPIYVNVKTGGFFSGEAKNNGYTIFNDKNIIEINSIPCRWYEKKWLDSINFETKKFVSGDLDFDFSEAKIRKSDTEDQAEKKAEKFLKEYFLSEELENKIDEYYLGMEIFYVI